MSTRKSSYTPLPKVPEEVLPRLAAIVEVLAGLKSVSEAARSLGLSRNHFQTILHRAVLTLAESITPKSGGRPARPIPIATLSKQLKRENARLHKRVAATEQLLEVAGGLLKGRIRPSRRQRRTPKTSAARSEGSDDSDPATSRQRTLEAVMQMRTLGLTQRLASAIAGIDPSTLRRWCACASSPAPTRRKRRRIEPGAAAQAEGLVRCLHGLIGADALRHSVDGLSRRAAACIKARTLCLMERERKQALRRVHVTQPGIVRSLDAMHLISLEGPLHALIAADAAVPYRTSVTTGLRYDAPLVRCAVQSDLERHGAPLVLRMDRARAHDAPEVREVLDAYGVLVLHGPPHYPCFYGQLERQNREHRAWLGSLCNLSRAALEPCLQEMLDSVNALWRRRTLHWKTAAELWNARPRFNIDRIAFREEVHDRAIRIARSLRGQGQPADLAERLAIERTLERMGYLRQEVGGWC